MNPFLNKEEVEKINIEANLLNEKNDEELKNIFLNFKVRDDLHTEFELFNYIYPEYIYIKEYPKRSFKLIEELLNNNSNIFNRHILRFLLEVLCDKYSNENGEKLNIPVDFIYSIIDKMRDYTISNNYDMHFVNYLIMTFSLSNNFQIDLERTINTLIDFNDILINNYTYIGKYKFNYTNIMLNYNLYNYFIYILLCLLKDKNGKEIFNKNIDFFKRIINQDGEPGEIVRFNCMKFIHLLKYLNEEFVKENLCPYLQGDIDKIHSRNLWLSLLNAITHSSNKINFIIENIANFSPINNAFMTFIQNFNINNIDKHNVEVFLETLFICANEYLIQNKENEINECKILIQSLTEDNYKILFEIINKISSIEKHLEKDKTDFIKLDLIKFLKTYISVQKKYNTLEIISYYLGIGYNQKNLKEVYKFLEKRKILSENRKFTFDNLSRFLYIILELDYFEYKRDKSVENIYKHDNEALEVLIDFKNNYLDEQSLEKDEIVSLFFSKLEEIKNNK